MHLCACVTCSIGRRRAGDGAVGSIQSFRQELRLTGNSSNARWILGANYSHDKASEQQILRTKASAS